MHGEIRSCRVCIRRPRPLSHLSKLCLVLCWFMVLTEGDNDWPTYPHPDYTSEKCYLCPPGFYKSEDCKVVRGEGPKWPTCIACHSSQFSQRWNEDGRCWDREHCKKNHTEIYNGGMYGPTKCACTGSTLEDESGTCVDGISLSKHTAQIKRLKTACEKRVKAASETVVVPPTKIVTITQPPCTAPDVAYPLCEVCPTIPTPEQPLEFGIVIGVIIGISITLLSFCIINYYSKTKKTNREKNGEVKKDAKLENGDLKHNGETKGKADQQTPPSSRQRSSGTSEHLVTTDNDSENTPLVGVPDPNDRMIKKEFDKKARKSDRHSDEFVVVDIENEKKCREPAATYHDEPHSDEKALPIDSITAPVQPQYRAPTTIQTKQDRDLLDEALRVIEKNVASIGEVDFILRDVLDFKAKECEKMKNDNHSKITETMRAGFEEWCEREGKEATPRKLILSFKKHDRNSMADKISEALGIKVEEESRRHKEDDFDEIVKICEKILIAEHFLEFFRSDLEVFEVENLYREDRKTFVRRGLLKWREKKGKDATPQKLLQLLANDSNLKNYADKVGEEFYGAQGEIGEAVMHDDGAAETKVQAGPEMGAESGTVRERPHLESSSSEPRSQNSTNESGSGIASDSQTQDPRTRTFPPALPLSHAPAVGTPVGDLMEENLSSTSSETTNPKTISNDAPGSSAPETTQGRRRLLSECQRVKDEDGSAPMEYIDNEEEEPDYGGKAGLTGTTDDNVKDLEKKEMKSLETGTKTTEHNNSEESSKDQTLPNTQQETDKKKKRETDKKRKTDL